MCRNGSASFFSSPMFEGLPARLCDVSGAAPPLGSSLNYVGNTFNLSSPFCGVKSESTVYSLIWRARIRSSSS